MNNLLLVELGLKIYQAPAKPIAIMVAHIVSMRPISSGTSIKLITGESIEVIQDYVKICKTIGGIKI